jgi:hypothetical protein
MDTQRAAELIKQIEEQERDLAKHLKALDAAPAVPRES